LDEAYRRPGLQYDFLSREQIEAGHLNADAYRVFIMPKSVAVSEREAGQIREFVQAGGLVLADFAIGTMNEHGRDLGSGQLDDVFGIGRAPPGGRQAVGPGKATSVSIEAGNSIFLRLPSLGLWLRQARRRA
jgi:Beta-galactosidase trimerisation domain